MGGIIGGATFGDNVSPISDTTIASALTQGADIAGVVRSRIRYAIPAAIIAVIAYAALGSAELRDAVAPQLAANPKGLVMLAVPVMVIALLLSGRHLLEGLLIGILTAVVIGLGFRLIEPSALLFIDPERFAARGMLVEGMERGIGASVFTLLLMGLVAPLEASGLLERIVAAAGGRAQSPRAAEGWIVGVTTASALITTHSTVAILTAGDFVRRTGERFGIEPYRRANLMDIVVCGFPFILPYMIPTILAASTSAAGDGFGMPRLTPFDNGAVNFHSWALLAVLGDAVITGYGRR
jgi:Na+/H+ antiporter NhaC